uniref:ARAD1B12936p n=1 Tax=Blastobotrys adeninivorans TaxID=409370 RepID=A0A060T5M5_BLAAD
MAILLDILDIMSEQLGFVGLGNMGIQMSQNLQKYLTANKLPNLMAYNRTAAKGEPLQALGGVLAPSISELVQKCSIVIFMMSTEDATADAIDQALTVDVKGKLLVSTATVSPEFARKLGEKVNGAGACYLSSPVFGMPTVAAAAQLIFAVSGKKEHFDRFEPYTKSMGKAQYYLGEDYGQAPLMKITGNTFILGLVELVGETMAFGESAGISSDIITRWAEDFAGPSIAKYFHKNSDGVYSPGKNGRPFFSIPNGQKDGGFAKKIADDNGASLPIMETVLSNFAELSKRPEDNLDVSAVYGLMREKAGLDFENEAVKKRGD